MTNKINELPSAKVKMVALNKLIPSKDNARRSYAKGEVEQMAASLMAQGQLQNVVVQQGKGDLLEVTAGGKRLAALKLLAKQGKIKKDHPVACQTRAREEAAEITLAENIIRSDMHPADEIVAYGKLNKESNLPPEEIAARFGVSHMTVRRRLKLASLSPKIIDAFRKDEASLQQLEALALTDDQALQESLFFTEHSWQNQPHHIRKALSNDGVAASSNIATFVTIKAYEDAGGKVVRDLFDDRNSGYLTDSSLLMKLAMEKLEAEAKTYEGKGWKWVEVSTADHHWNYRSLAATVSYSAKDQKRVDKLQDQLEALHNIDDRDDEDEAKIERIEGDLHNLEQANKTWSDEAKALSGVYLSIGNSGERVAYEGLQKPEDAKAEDRKLKLAAHAGAGADEAAQSASLSAAVIEDLSKTRTVALGFAMADNPAVAVRALAFSLIQQYLVRGSHARVLSIHATSPSVTIEQPDTENTACYVALEKKKQAILLDLPQDPAGLWDYLLSISSERVNDLLALCVGLSVDVVVPRHAPADNRKLATAGLFAETLGFKMADWWKPTQAFFKRVSKSVAVQAFAQAGLPAQAAEGLLKLKKDEAAASAARSLEGLPWLPEAIASFPALATSEPAEDDMEDLEDEEGAEADYNNIEEAA